MAFCENCGAQLSNTGKFCSSCGKGVGENVTTAFSQPSRRSPIAKLAFGGVALLLLLAVGIIYVSHRANQMDKDLAQGLPEVGAIVKKLQSEGSQDSRAPKANAGATDLSPVMNALQSPASQPGAPSPASQTRTATLDENKTVTPGQGQCALFGKEELTRVLGTNFTHADSDATGCTYKGDAPREFVRTEALWKGGGKLVKDKSDALADMRHSMVNLHYSKAEIASHSFPITPYPGVGDEAFVNMWNTVSARKGDVGITMDLRFYPDEDTTKLLLNAALSRLKTNDSDSAATPN